MHGYLKTPPYVRITNIARRTDREEVEHESQLGCSVAHRNTADTKNPQTAGYLSWESVSYFFGWRTTANGAPDAQPLGKTEVNSRLSQPLKKQLPEARDMEKTIEYTVTSYDTLPKIALKFDVTPSELTRLNRLVIRTLYPGQVLKVPCPKPPDDCPEYSEAVVTTEPPPKPIPMNYSHMHKVPVAKRVSFNDIDEDVLETFIKIRTTYITDGQGVVKGCLLITPHAVIFNPDVSEILVVDRGAEYYHVNFPMDSVCAAGVFDDIASMVGHDALQPGHFFLDKPLMMWLGEANTKELPKEDSSSTLHDSSSISRDDTVESIAEITESFPMDTANVPKTDTSSETMIIADILNDVLEQVDEKIARAGGEDVSTLDSSLESHSEEVISSSHQRPASDENHHPMINDNEQLPHLTSAGHAHSTPKRGPYQEHDNERYTKGTNGDSEGHSYSEGISTDSGIDEHLSRENVDGDFGDPQLEDLKTYQRSAFDSIEVIPRLSTCHVNMPKYLCVKIKRACWPTLRPKLCLHAHHSIQRASDERREFWFSIPCERLIEVYSLFLEWCTAIHEGESDDGASDDEKDLVASGCSDFSIVTMSELEEAGLNLVDNFFSSSPEKENKQPSKIKWPKRKGKKKKTEIKEPQRKPSSWSMCSIEDPLPEMIGKSEILTETDILQLSRYLPSRTIGHSWRLIYSTYIHGISLKTLYRTLAEYDTPALLVIVDGSRKVFGAFASSPFAVSEHFYGTGECFLYSFYPELRVFRWSGENHFFIKGDIDSLAFGGGEGNFGLWLDEDLYHGSSHPCKTFNNEPLTIAEDFLCSGVEIWCFE